MSNILLSRGSSSVVNNEILWNCLLFRKRKHQSRKTESRPPLVEASGPPHLTVFLPPVVTWKLGPERNGWKGEELQKAMWIWKGTDWSGSPEQSTSPIATDNHRHGDAKDQEMVGGLATCCWSRVDRDLMLIISKWQWLGGERRAFDWLIDLCLVSWFVFLNSNTFINLRSNYIGRLNWTWA